MKLSKIIIALGVAILLAATGEVRCKNERQVTMDAMTYDAKLKRVAQALAAR